MGWIAISKTLNGNDILIAETLNPSKGMFMAGGRVRRTKAQMTRDRENKEIDAYNWYVVDLETNRAITGNEYKEDAIDALSDYDGDKRYKVVSKKTLKSLGIENPNERFKSYEYGGDLFQNYDEQPEELAEIVNFYAQKFDEDDYDYEDSQNFLKAVEEIGYTFDYGLDNEPYGLRPIGTELDEYAGGGGVGNDRYEGKTNKIIEELKKIQGGLDNKPPNVYVKNGLIYVSAENGDNYADYDNYLYIDEKLENFADKYDTYWDWEDAGSIVLTPLNDVDEYSNGGAIANQQFIADAHLRPAEMFGREGIPAYARGGGLRTHNGREYSTGRNWTNDHRHHNQEQDYEVSMYNRKK
jgi:hypothetical protein